MSASEAYDFTFTVDVKPKVRFTVISFRGYEYVSNPYRFEIVLAANDPNLKAADFVHQACHLKIVGHDKDAPRIISGIVFLFRHIRRLNDMYVYQVVLMPRLQFLALNTRTRVFLKQSCLTMIESILKDEDIEYEIRIAGNQAYPEREYSCQFEETDFAFVSRWLEKQGLAYFFEERSDGKAEILVLADAKDAQLPCRKDNKAMRYTPPSGMEPEERDDVVQTFVSEHGSIPKYVHLRDYNYENQLPNLRASTEVENQVARGVVWQYGRTFLSEHYGVGEEKILAQQLESMETTYQGETFCPDLRAGTTLKLENHYRDEYNDEFYICRVTHEGVNKKYTHRHWQPHDPGKKDDNGQTVESRQMYSNVFHAIPADVHYRPRKLTPVPRFTGMLTAFIYAEGGKEGNADGEDEQTSYAFMDEAGRYKVQMPFDLWEPKKQSAEPGEKGKASHWIRLAEPFAGNALGENAFGMHFPLHKGTEVLISFVEGDIDRPVIVGALYNKNHTNPVNSTDPYRNVIRTKNGCKLEMYDMPGHESIAMACPGNESIVVCNPKGVTVGAKGDAVEFKWNDSFGLKVGSDVSFSAGSSTSAFGGTKASLTVGFSTSLTLGMSVSAELGGKVDIGGKKNFIHSDFSGSAEDTLSLKGGMSVVLKKYYNTIKYALGIGGLGAIPTGLGSWAAVAGATHQNKDIHDTAAIIGGSVTASLGLLGETIGRTIGLGTYRALSLKKKDALYTSSLDLGKDGAKLLVNSPVGSKAECTLCVSNMLAKKSEVTIGSKGENLSLNNWGTATLEMKKGKQIDLQVDAPITGTTSSSLSLQTGKLSLKHDGGGELSMDSNQIALKREMGAKILMKDSNLKLANGSNSIEITNMGVSMKFVQDGKIQGGMLKFNADEMLMLG